LSNFSNEYFWISIILDQNETLLLRKNYELFAPERCRHVGLLFCAAGSSSSSSVWEAGEEAGVGAVRLVRVGTQMALRPMSRMTCAAGEGQIEGVVGTDSGAQIDFRGK